MVFLDCPAYLDRDGAHRCALPAEVEDRTTMHSSDGPAEILKIRCPAGHWFNGPVDCLALPAPAKVGEPATADPQRTR